jgi:plastocyanin
MGQIEQLMRRLVCAVFWVACCLSARAEEAVVTGRVELSAPVGEKWRGSLANSAVWLTPLAGARASEADTGDPKSPPRLIQKNKSFQPRVVILRAGTAAEFPNHDPIFHNVFSLFDGKRFDLGLYEAGGTRLVHFDRPGISYIFCNIHPEMSAVVIAVGTPYFGLSDNAGNVTIRGLAPGRYMLHIWNERVLPVESDPTTRVVTVTQGTTSFGTVHLPISVAPQTPHKNKYGRDYDPSAPANPVYEQH